MSKRTDRLKAFAAQAKHADEHHDAVLRTQAANSWHSLATEAESARAPRYLTWTGRK